MSADADQRPRFHLHVADRADVALADVDRAAVAFPSAVAAATAMAKPTPVAVAESRTQLQHRPLADRQPAPSPNAFGSPML